MARTSPWPARPHSPVTIIIRKKHGLDGVNAAGAAQCRIETGWSKAGVGVI